MSGVAILAKAALIAGCVNEPSESVGVTTSPTPAATMAPGASARVVDVTGNLDAYVGKTVTIVADVEEVLGPRSVRSSEPLPLSAHRSLFPVWPWLSQGRWR